jgi:hypothetical protein
MPVQTQNAVEDSLTELDDDSFYPSQLFSMSDYYMPDSIKEVFRYCKYLALSDPMISGAIHKLAEAPITEIVYEHEKGTVKDRYKKLFEKKLDTRERFMEAGFDLMTYSNAFLSFEVPVQRYLISPNLAGDSTMDRREFKKHSQAVQDGDLEKYKFDLKYQEEVDLKQGRLPDQYKAENINWSLTGDGRFKGPCPKTGKEVIFERQDRYYASADNVRIKRWDPNRIEIHHNEVTGKNRYFYDLKHSTRELIKDDNRRHYNQDPWAYIRAARENRNVKIKRDQLYHLSNVKISGAFDGWGVPRLYSAFKLIFYYMTLLRSNESVARGKIQDLNILFPQSQSGMLDPVAAMPGSSFKREVKSILKNWKEDRNFVGVSPIPVGNVSIFGEGRMQLVSSEMKPILRMITTALGIPFDILFGGAKYSGQAVQQRLFSAQTGLHAARFNEALDFFQEKASGMLGEDRYPSSMNMRMKDYEGPDENQKKKTRAQAAMNQMLSVSTFWEDQGLDPEQEWSKMEEDAKRMNEIKEIRAEGKAHAKAEGQEIVERMKMDLQKDKMEQKQEMKREMRAEQMKQKAKAQSMQDQQEGGPGSAPNGAQGQEGEQPEEEPQGEPSQEAQQIAAQMLEYLKDNPNQQKRVLQYAKARKPEAFKILRKAIQKQDGNIPDAEMPTLDAEVGSGPGGDDSGVEVGPETDSPRQTAGQQQGGKMNMMDGQKPQPEQKPPQRRDGGL